MSKESNYVLEQRIRELEAENEMLREENSGLAQASTPVVGGQVSTLSQALTGPKYRFKVVARAESKKMPEVAPVVIEAPDESEAVRLACLVMHDEKGNLVPRESPVNPSAYHFRAECLDSDKRKPAIVSQYEEAKIPERERPSFARPVAA